MKMYSTSEQYFKETYSLYSPDDSEDMTNLQCGQHKFDFEYRLLPDLPSSFEGEYGYVRFSIKCVISKPWKYDHSTKAAFTVLSKLNLNTTLGAQEPIYGTDIATDAFCCYCDQGAIFADLSLERRGYVPGEAIRVHARIRNSTQYLVNSQVQLCQIISFHAAGKAKECKKIVNSIKHELTDIDETDTWGGDKLLIPPVPPSELLGCNIIDIKYYVLLKSSADDSSTIEATIPLDILIGTVPLRSAVQAYRQQRLNLSEVANGVPSSISGGIPVSVSGLDRKDGPIVTPPKSISTSSFSDEQLLSPPSYETCLFGRVNIREEDDTDFTRGAMEFAPMYAFYDWERNKVQNSCQKQDKDDTNFV
ncbi:arrestin domain-containing protein 3-like [Liolophura sinensis]|uniref:arrestin domain-containing protein 3-like n=1 Tax=Liolophura sinensis TaxID=3198878 RepID=UPI003159917E